MKFPDNFTWGAATSSYQIEGAVGVDGHKESVWDVFCRRPHAIMNHENGRIACDHYHRYKEDVALMKQMGLQAYRFSVSWPRVLPEGTGAANPAGLSFYDALVDELLAAGIQPCLTLFHWDYPCDLYLRGGWLNPSSPDWFAEYAGLLAARLSDRVTCWMTLNEPQCFIGSGHLSGEDAPGDRLEVGAVLIAAHHALLAHGKAVQAVRAAAKRPVQVGCAPVGVTYIPASESADDIAAAREIMFSVRRADFWNNTWWMDPMILGTYPEDGLETFGASMPSFYSRDMDIIRQPLDFYGANIYHGQYVRRGPDGHAEILPYPQGQANTAYPWPVTPAALYWGPRFLFERCRLPLLITENGMACNDWVALDGRIHDPQRIDFTARYLMELKRAMADGAKVDGYFHWSLMDNFEWTYGYLLRFGLIHVDFETQRRTLKDSALWYREVILSNGDNIIG